MSNNILKAFLEQSGIDPNHINQSDLYEDFDDASSPDGESKVSKIQDMKLRKNLSAGLSSNIQSHIDIPTQNPEISQKTESHPHFKDYDHSLDQSDRWPAIGGKGGGDSSIVDVEIIEDF